MRIRQATIMDLDEVMELYYEASDAMEGTPYDCCWRREGHPSRELVRGLIEDGNMLVATQDAELIGAVGMDHDLGHDYGDLSVLTEVPDKLVAVIHLLVVAEGWRGRGLSRLLLRECFDVARAAGLRTARLDITANNLPAKTLYLSEGFSEIGRGIQDVGPEENPLVPFLVFERLI